MEQALTYRDAGKVVFRVLGIAVLASFLVSNPIVLRPRFWTTAVVVRSLILNAAQLAIGMELIRLRRWAAAIASLVAAYAAFTLGQDVHFALRLILLMPLLLTVMFWASLEWSFKRRDCLYLLAAIAMSALFQYIAFLRRIG